MKEFNITGVCDPHKHYMVDTGKIIDETMKFVHSGKYFTINRARQYGKTTTLRSLEKAMLGEYICVSLSFEGRDSMFESEEKFCRQLHSSTPGDIRLYHEDINLALMFLLLTKGASHTKKCMIHLGLLGQNENGCQL